MVWFVCCWLVYFIEWMIAQKSIWTYSTDMSVQRKRVRYLRLKSAHSHSMDNGRFGWGEQLARTIIKFACYLTVHRGTFYCVKSGLKSTDRWLFSEKFSLLWVCSLFTCPPKCETVYVCKVSPLAAITRTIWSQSDRHRDLQTMQLPPGVYNYRLHVNPGKVTCK